MSKTSGGSSGSSPPVSNDRILHTFVYGIETGKPKVWVSEEPDVEPDVIEPTWIACIGTDQDTIMDALNNCPFYTTLDKETASNVQIQTYPDRRWLPHNFPCYLIPDMKVNGQLVLVVKRMSSAQPEYPVRSLKPQNGMFTIQIGLHYHRAARGRAPHVLNVRGRALHVLNFAKTSTTPKRLIVGVDPTKSIRESLKDDGRFSAKVLEGRYTHLVTKLCFLFPADVLGTILERNAEYDICIKAPEGFRARERNLYKKPQVLKVTGGEDGELIRDSTN